MKHKVTFNALLVLVLFLTLAPTIMASTTWYVNSVSGSDKNHCISPQTAFCKTIGHAISLAASGDSISVAAATYSENLTISKSLKISGSGAATTIVDGGGAASVVTITNTSASVRLANVTIRHGYARNGGGIYNSGTLTITNSSISGNQASCSNPGIRCIAGGGGIYNAGTGTLTIYYSAISGNAAFCRYYHCDIGGGGISNAGTLTIYNSTISGNWSSAYVFFCGPPFCNREPSSSSGGGVANSGTLAITNSTLSSNSARLYWAFFNIFSGFGGGIYNYGDVAFSSNTLSGNSALGIGGGIYNLGSVVAQNTIVANSSSGGNCSGPVTSKGYNLSSDNTCNFNGPRDMNKTDPMLGTLGNYHGPTQTIPLLTGSPAIDAGNPGGCTDGSGNLLKTDQRGYPRHDLEDARGCDIGAFEKQSD